MIFEHASACHPERSEGSLPCGTQETHRSAQRDGYSRQSHFHGGTGRGKTSGGIPPAIRFVGVLATILSCAALWAVSRYALGGDTNTPATAADIKRSELKSGPGQGLNGLRIFPPDDPWNTDVSKQPVDPDSDALIASIGLAKGLHPDFGTSMSDGRGNTVPNGIPYIIVSASQPKVPVTFQYSDESDPGPYPIPPDAPIEGGPKSDGDRHILVIDKDNWKLYETWSSYPQDGGKSFKAGSGAIFDLTRKSVQRPAGWTSSDAAGLPVFAGLARYDEIVEQGKLTHALRFTVVRSRHGYVYPATHFASNKTDKKLPPMGMRVRLKAGFDTSKFQPAARVILEGLKTYGMIVADNGGDWFITGAPDPRWNDDELGTLRTVKGADFEVVKMGEVVTK